MNKVTSYLKNVGKSIGYASIEVTKGLIPEVDDFIDTNQDIFKSIYATVSHSKKSMGYGRKLAQESQIYKDIDKGIQNVLSDIKTGNFYNKARSQEAIDRVGESMAGGFDDFGSDDDFNFDDFDFEDDDNESESSNVMPAAPTRGDIYVADSVTKSGNLSAQLISKTIANTTKSIIKTNVSTTNMVMAQNIELMAGLRTSIAGMHQSINSILNFANNELRTQITNETKYFETTTSIMQENNAILKEMLEMQRNLYKAESEKSTAKDQFSNVFTAGTMDIKEYMKAVFKNAKGLDKTGTIDMILGSSEGGGGVNFLEQMFTNPLGFVMTNLVASQMPKSLAKSISSFSKTLGNIFPVMIARLNKWKKDDIGGIRGIIGQIFGLSTDTKKSIDTDKYNKGAVPFDGITRKAIVDVIPEHLSRIESLLAGSSQRVYDYETGKWTDASSLKKKFEDDYAAMVVDSFSDMKDVFGNFTEAMKEQKALDFENTKKLQEDIAKLMKYTVENDEGLLSPESIKKNKYMYGFSSDDDIIDALIESLSKVPASKLGSVAKNTFENRKRYGDNLRAMEEKGDNIIRKLFDNSKLDDHLVFDENFKNIITGTKSNSLSSVRDKLGNTSLDYLSDIAKDLRYIRQYGLGGRNTRSNQNKVSFEDFESDYDSKRVPKYKKEEREKLDKESSYFNKSYYKNDVDKDKALSGAIFNVISKASDVDEDEIEKFKDDDKYYAKGKYADIVNKIPGKTTGEKFKNAKSFKEKYYIISDSLRNLSRKPAEILTGVLNRAQDSIYDWLFKADTDEEDDEGKDIKGNFRAMMYKFQDYATQLLDKFTEKVLDPIANKLGLNDKWDKFKNRAKNTNFAQRLKDVKGSLFSSLKSNASGIGNYVKDSVGYTTDTLIVNPITNRKIKNNDRKINDILEKIDNASQEELANIDLSKLSRVERAAIPSSYMMKIYQAKAAMNTNINSKAYGGKVEGLDDLNITITNKDEDLYVINKEKNLSKIKRNAKKESKLANVLSSSLKNNIFTKASGGVVSDKNKKSIQQDFSDFMYNKIQEQLAERRKKRAEDIRNRLFTLFDEDEEFKSEEKLSTENNSNKENKKSNTSKSNEPIKENITINFNDEISKLSDLKLENNKIKNNKNLNTVGNIIIEEVTDNVKKSVDSMIGLSGNDKEKEEQIEKEKNNLFSKVGNVLKEMNGSGYDLAAKSILGGGIGLLSGIIGGPLIGAGIGAAISLSKNSKTVNNYLFGKEVVDEKTGEVTFKEGKISKSMQDTFKKYVPDMGKFGVTGAIASLVLPFGPLVGAALGAGVGLAKNSETMNEMIFGDEGGLLNKKRREKIKEYFPKAAAGAAAGVLLGPFGILGNAVLGSGIGMLTGTEEFKDLILGEPGPNGTRFGGVKGALDDHFIKPLKEFGSNFKDDFFGFIKESMIDPLNNAITPIANEIAFQTKRVVFGIPKMFAKLGKEYIAIPFMSGLKQYFLEPLGGLANRLLGGSFNKVKGVISAPFRAVGAVGTHLRKKQIRQGRDTIGTAKDRIQFAQDKKMGDYKYRAFDEALADNSDNEEYLKEITARTGMLAYGAEYFEKQVQQTGKELSKVLDDYIKLGWLSKNKKAYKRIKKYIKNNDVESAIQELSQIKESRTDGGKMSDENADEAIRRFTEANKAYQATKKARDAFGDINDEDNKKWMKEQFGSQWKKYDAKNLFKYASKELANKTGKDEITKQDLFKDPTKLITEGDNMINRTLTDIKNLIISASKGEFFYSKDSKEYDKAAEKGKNKAKEQRMKQKINMKATLSNKGLDYEDDVVSLLYSNEKIYQLVLYNIGNNISYDIDTIKKLCSLRKLSNNDITMLKKYPYVALLPKKELVKYLSKYRNNHATILKNGKMRNRNLKLINDAYSKGVDLANSKDVTMATSGSFGDSYSHKLRNEYFAKFNELGLIGKTVKLNGKDIELSQENIIDNKKGLSFEDMNSIIKNNNGKADIKNDRTSIRSGLHNFSDKHLGFARTGIRKTAKFAGIAGGTALAAPIALPIAALGLGGLGIAKGAQQVSLLKNLGLGGYISDKFAKHKSESDINSEKLTRKGKKYSKRKQEEISDEDKQDIAKDTNTNIEDESDNNGKEIINKASEKKKTFFTENGIVNYIKNKRGEWKPSTDSQTKQTLEKNNDDDHQQSKILGTLTSMKDGILGIFNRNKKKDEEEEKEPFLKRLFSFDLGSISGKLKLGGLLLGGMTAIGALKNLWDNRTPGGVIDTLGTKFKDSVSNISSRLIDWFTGEGESKGKGLPNILEKYVYPNLFTGFNVIFQKVLPALLKSFIISLPTIIKAGVSGIASLIKDLFGWGRDDSHDDDNKISASDITVGDGKSTSSISSGLVSADGGNSTWLDKVLTDAQNIAIDMIGTAEASNNNKTYVSSTKIDLPSLNDQSTTATTSNTTGTNYNTTSTTTQNGNIAPSIIDGNYRETNITNTTTTSSNTQLTDEQIQILSEPLYFGGVQGFKKDEKGNLIPLTGQDYKNYADNGQSIPEFYTKEGARYIYDEESGMYISEKGDTYTELDDGFVNRMAGVFGRSMLTGKNMGVMRLAKFATSKFSGTMVGKMGKGMLNITDKMISHIPFIKTPYKVGKSAIGGLSKFASGVSNAGVTANRYVSYAKDALKEGYKPKEIISDISEDIVGKGKETKAGKMIASAKEKVTSSKTVKTITDTAKATKDKVLNSKTGKKIAEIGSKTTEKVSGITKKIIDWVKSGLEYIFNNDTIFGKIKSGLKKAGKESSEKSVKKVIKEMIEKLISKFSSSILGKVGTKITTKLSAAIGSAGTITAIFSIVDFTVGFDQAESILGIEEVSFVQKLLAGLINIVTNELFFGLIDAKTVVDWCVDIIFPFFNINVDDFEKEREEAEKNTEKYNKEHGTNMSTEERLKDDKLTWKITKAWEGTKEFAGDVVEGTKNIVSDAWNGAKNFGGGVIDWVKEKVTGKSSDKKKESAKNKDVDKNKSDNKSSNGLFSGLSSAISKTKDSINNAISKSNTDILSSNSLITQTGNLQLAESQSNGLDVTTQNVESAYTIMDLELGKMYGFTDSNGKSIGLSQGIENYSNTTGKNEFTFADIKNTLSMQMQNLNSTIQNNGQALTTNTTNATSSAGGFFSNAVSNLANSISSFTSGMGTGKKSGYISQLDPEYKNQRFNKSGDTEYQTIGDSGCAPATAANVLNLYNGRGSEMKVASKEALKYKDKDGGVNPAYFENYLGNNGISTYSTMNKNEMINNIASGNPTILLGSDPTNKANTPYGSASSHYVLATGVDGRGNVIVQNPESRRPNALYPVKDLIKQSHLGMVTGRGTGINRYSKSRLGLSKIGFGRGSLKDQDLATWSALSDSEIDAFIKKKRSDCPFTGAMINKAAAASGLDPRYILAHAAVESAWGTSNQGKKYHNYFGIGAFDSNPDNAKNYSNGGVEAGLVNGAVWIRQNYYDKGQKTVYTMRYNNGTHEYCTSGTWVNSITNIMGQMPANTNAQYHESNGTISSSDSSSSGISGFFDSLSALPEAYFGKELMSLFGFSSSDSSSSSSTSIGQGVEGAAAQMEAWANDPNVGYDQTYRWGERGDYDCSSAVISAYEKAGIPVKSQGGANATGNMVSAFKKTGFTDVTNQVDLSSGNGLVRGDVLWRSGHTAMYAGNGKKVEASINEKGTATGGQPGDQTGKEFLISNYKNSNWKTVLRYSGSGSGSTKKKTPKYLNNIYSMTGKGTSTINNNISDMMQRVSTQNLGYTTYSNNEYPNIRTTSLPSLQSTNINNTSDISNSSNSKIEKLLQVIIEILQLIANNSDKLSEVVSLLSRALDVNLTDNDISKLSNNNVQIKNKIANALKAQGSGYGMGNEIMNANTESLASAMYAIARA